jgi:hypothetical protein
MIFEKTSVTVTIIKRRSLYELEHDSAYDIMNEMKNVLLELWIRQLEA